MPPELVSVLLALPFTIACAYYAGQVAGRRGRSVRLWMWMGALFGPFVFPVLYILGQKRRRTP